jgi:membrane-bound serine protease (ClpP class)
MIGAEGIALEAFEGRGSVRVHSEVWAARSDGPVAKGQRVRVSARHGLVLEVSATEEAVS